MPVLDRTVAFLERGQSFIWLDDNTRSDMCAGPETGHVQVLKCLTTSGLDDDGEGQITFEYLNGSQERLWYNESNRAIVLPPGTTEFIRYEVKCDNCGERHGEHFTKSYPISYGIHCKKFGSGYWFIPNEKSLRMYHPEIFPKEDDFFSSIGL